MITPRYLLAAVLTSVFAAAAAAAPPVERDVWYADVDEDLRYGARHVVVTGRPDGHFRYVVETRALIDLFGAQRQETHTRAETLVTADLTPVSLRATLEQMSGGVEVAGSMGGPDGRTWTVDVDRGGVSTTSTWTFGIDEAVVLESALDDWLAGFPRGTTAVAARVVDDATGQVRKITAERIPDALNTAWMLRSDDRYGPTTLELDTNGVTRELWHRTPKVHRRRCSAEEAARLDYRVWDGRELLTFPVDVETGPVHGLERLTVLLEWREVPFEDVDLEDIRQRVVQQCDEGGEYEVVVEIGRIELPTPLPLPIDAAELAPYLDETDFIKPSDDAIVAAVREAVPEGADALETVRSLCAFVHGHIEGALIAETLTGPEVLRQRTGKCSEYTTLFASMSRAAGIPTRVVLGERLVTGRWMGHMWAEAYVGAWIPVDPSADEVGDTCALLKLVDSPTVQGTQAARWALSESLDISVLEVERRPDALADLYETGIDGSVYTNVAYGMRITAPVPTWRLEDLSSAGAATVRFHVPDQDDVLIHLVVFDLPPGTEPVTITSARVGLFRSRAASFELQLDRPRAVAGLAGHMTRSLAGEAETGEPYLTTEVVWTNGPVGCLVNLISPEAVHADRWPDVERLLEGFELLTDTAR